MHSKKQRGERYSLKGNLSSTSNKILQIPIFQVADTDVLNDWAIAAANEVVRLLFNMDPYDDSVPDLPDGKPQLLYPIFAFVNMARLVAELLFEVLPHIPLSEHQQKADKLMSLWKQETQKAHKTDVVDFRVSASLEQRKKFFKGRFVYLLWLELKIDVTGISYAV